MTSIPEIPVITVDAIVAALNADPHDDGVSYRVLLSPGNVHVAVDVHGLPSLLVPVQRLPDRRNFVVGDVRLTTHEMIRFQVANTNSETPALIVTCLDRDRPQSFSVFLLDLVHRLNGATQSPLVIIELVLHEWHEMLTRRERLTVREETGLWGELAILQTLPDLDQGLVAWTGPSGDSVDFRSNGVALECKTSTVPWRHTLSLQQVEQVQADHAATYLVSIWIGTDAAGRSLPELIESIDGRLTDPVEFRRRLLKVGYAYEQRELYSERYTLLRGPAFIPMASVPRVRHVDPGVSQVRFTVSVEGCEPVQIEESVKIQARLVARREENDAGE
jgi:hypothetical protein